MAVKQGLKYTALAALAASGSGLIVDGPSLGYDAVAALVAVVIGWADESISTETAVHDVVGIVLAITLRSGIGTGAGNEETGENA